MNGNGNGPVNAYRYAAAESVIGDASSRRERFASAAVDDSNLTNLSSRMSNNPSDSVSMSNQRSFPYQSTSTPSLATHYPSRHPPPSIANPTSNPTSNPTPSPSPYPHRPPNSHLTPFHSPPNQYHSTFPNGNSDSTRSSTPNPSTYPNFNPHQRYSSHPQLSTKQSPQPSNHNHNYKLQASPQPSAWNQNQQTGPSSLSNDALVNHHNSTSDSNAIGGLTGNESGNASAIGSENGPLTKGKKRQRETERKPRVNLSCLPCKQRKIKCDRNVPQCESCIKRGISHLCAFGDERDDLVPKNNSPTTAALLAKISHLESQLKAFKNANDTKKSNGKEKSEDETDEMEESEMKSNGSESGKNARREDEENISNQNGKISPTTTTKESNQVNKASVSRTGSFDENESENLIEETVSTIDSDPSHWGKPIQKPSAAEIKAAATAPESSDVRPVPIKGGGGKPIDENTLDNFYNLLPSRKITDYLIEHFIIYVHNSIPCLHVPTLRRHYLNVMNRKLKGNNRDLNILSLIFIIFEASCESLSPAEIFKLGLTSTRQDLASLLDSFHTLSHRLLHLSHFYSAPTLEGFQAIVITRSYWFERRAVVGYSALNVRAIRLAQSIGLHKLGNFNDDWDEWERRKSLAKQDQNQKAKEMEENGEDPKEIKELLPTLFFRPQDNHPKTRDTRRDSSSSSNPNSASTNSNKSPSVSNNSKASDRSLKDEFGWDTPNPILTREIGRRVWTCLCIIEYFLCGYSGALPAIMPSAPGCTTSLPVSIEDEALDSITINSKRIYEKPLEEPTQLSFTAPHYFTSLCAVNSYAAMQRGDGYETVIKCNQEVKKILENLPSFYRLDGSEELPRVKNLHKERPYLNLHRSVLNDLLYYRLLVLNRMYMGVGYKTPKYSESTKLCLEAAHGIIKARLDFAKIRAYPLDLWITIVHVFHAACTLQLHLLHETDLHGWTKEMTHHQAAADDADRYLKSISYQSTGGKSGGSLCEALSKLREKTVARQQQVHPETPAPPRHSSHFLNVVLLDTSHSVGGGNGLNGNGGGNGNGNGNGNSKESENWNPHDSSKSNEDDISTRINTSPLTGGISQKPENLFPNEINPSDHFNRNLLSQSSNTTLNSSSTLQSQSNRLLPLHQQQDPSCKNAQLGQEEQRKERVENELPPADCYTEIQPYLDSFRSVERNHSDDSFLQILEELFSQ